MIRLITSRRSATLTKGDSTTPSVTLKIINQEHHERARRDSTARILSERRGFVDPTACEKDNSDAEIEFMRAMQRYKQTSGRMFPTWSEVLEVLKSLGYEKAELNGG
jgi:hypothetical protein